MNSRAVLVSVLFSSFCLSQATPPKSTTSPQSAQSQSNPKKDTDAAGKTAEKPALTGPPSATAVGVDEAVITIPGVCSAGTPADSCSTKITRGDFEQLIHAMNPNIPVEARRSIAGSYGQLVALANQAQKTGVDKDPNVQIQMHVQNMSLLAQALQKKVVENSKPTQQEMESYYSANSAKYEELNLRRIVILKSASGELKPEELKALADKIRTRAVAGEDADKLQVEAYKTTKSAGTPPSTSLGWKKRGTMDPRHEPQILPLKTGEVSPVMEDGQAYYIYKVDSKRLVPLESVQKEIENSLQTERAKKTLQQMMEGSKPQLNEAYFGPDPSKATPTLNPPK